ncbi:hypothetical protein IEO21_05851 [Rhodonia placenta]|uniref:alpha-1,2-Mannosidase n=1 Tax=Rhodonia placenta TaxID=104341 RepID=A0A8H7P160_9APHY|nr:hypothetical protein IEO21_05851 [Postia placenta]
MLRYLPDSFKIRRFTTRQLVAVAIALLVVLALYYNALPHYSDGRRWTPPPVAASRTPPAEWQRRADQVKQAFLHAYHGYETHAMLHDEIRPLSNQFKDNFNGWGVTLFDSLDTMILMDLNDEFRRALPVVEKADFMPSPNVTNKHVGYAPFFETVIRYLAGLLSAYALSREPILLQQAEKLGNMLSPAFDTPSGFPLFGVNIAQAQGIGSTTGILAEIASCQLEYTYLALLTGNKTYWDKADGVMQGLAQADLSALGGMMPRRWNVETSEPTDQFLSVGAATDSAHEYLLKQYLMTAKSDRTSYQMYLRATNHILTHLLYLSDKRGLLYVTDVSRPGGGPSHRFEHLSCFFPGLLALGADQLDLSLDDLDLSALGSEGLRSYEILKHYDLRALHKWAAEGLATTCYLLYADQPSGLAPDEPPPSAGNLWIAALERWREGGQRGSPPGLGEKPTVRFTEEELKNAKLRAIKAEWRDYYLQRTDYLLRPEASTVESLYLLWRTTGDPIWRERGWAIFEAIERETKTPSAYASIKDVLKSPAPQLDDMPSFFLAETLKYLYLTFLDEDPLPLDRWVFNTEAHPFPVFTWSSWEKEKFGIGKLPS